MTEQNVERPCDLFQNPYDSECGGPRFEDPQPEGIDIRVCAFHLLISRNEWIERTRRAEQAEQEVDRLQRHRIKHPHGSPSHAEGAWCSMGPDSCGQFDQIERFEKVEYGRYLIDGRGVPTVCYECRAVRGDVRQYPPVPVTLPHEHVAFYDRTHVEQAEQERDEARRAYHDLAGAVDWPLALPSEIPLHVLEHARNLVRERRAEWEAAERAEQERVQQAEQEVERLQTLLREGVRYVNSSSYPLQVSGMAGGWVDRVERALLDTQPSQRGGER